MNKLLVALLGTLTACSSTPGGSADGGEVPCTMTWTGAEEGEADCSGAASDELLAASTSTSASLNWLVTGETDTHTASFQYQVPNPPSESSYTGGTSSTQYCLVSLRPNDALGSYNTRSSEAGGMPPVGTCTLTFTEKRDTSSKTTTRFTVHGTATATLVSASDASQTVDLTVQF